MSTCLGVASQRLGRIRSAIEHYRRAIETRSLERDPVTRTPITDMRGAELSYYLSNVGFSVGHSDLLQSLFTLYNAARDYDSCLDSIAAYVGLEHPAALRSGSALILFLSFFDWTQVNPRLRGSG